MSTPLFSRRESDAAPVELALADWAMRHGGDRRIGEATAAIARAIGQGHACLGLDAISNERNALRDSLAKSPLVGRAGDARPLIHDRGRLYFHRYWRYETRLAERLRPRLAAAPNAVDTRPLEPAGGLFDYSRIAGTETNWQAVAAFVAQRHRLAIISGGPGTGKTYTVALLMLLLIKNALATNETPPVIRLAAPTGKAAARMLDSAQTTLASIDPGADFHDHVSREAATLHRLIGIGRNPTCPRHDRHNPLAADVVIVDEASMIDLPTMTKLLEALPDRARLVLLGDRYQLASVEAGSVLAELCGAVGINRFTPEQQQAAGALLRAPVETGTGTLADHIVTLQTSHRFKADSAIGALAVAVNDGNAKRAIGVAAESEPDIQWPTASDAQCINNLIEASAARHEAVMNASEPAGALAALQTHRVLCALRRGPAGSLVLNRRVNERLARRYGFDPSGWYPGRPIIVTRNDYRAELFNGDIGICLKDQAGDRLRVWFAADGGPRPFAPSSIPQHETVHAMTIHKSQGSEFEHVTLVLPAESSPILTRELLYTGITRARTTLKIIGAKAAFENAVGQRIVRHSGLAERIVDAD